MKSVIKSEGKTPLKTVEHLSALLLPREPDLYPANNPPSHKHADHAEEHDNRLPQAGRQRVVVGDDDLTVPELVHKVLRLDGYRCAADGVQVGLLGADGRLDDRGLGDVCVVLDVPKCKLVKTSGGLEETVKGQGILTRLPREGEYERSRLRTPHPRLA